MNPIERFTKLLRRAEKKKLPLHNAFNLATAEKKGAPSSRMMLLKGVDDRGFIFYTNVRSRKGKELSANPRAAICFWWPLLEEQVRIEGKVKPVSAIEADAYFTTRPRGSQLGAWVSQQSAPLASRVKFITAVIKLGLRYAGKKVPRPPHWSGFILAPEQIEFWHGRPDRLHQRELFTRHGRGTWKKQLLYP